MVSAGEIVGNSVKTACWSALATCSGVVRRASFEAAPIAGVRGARHIKQVNVNLAEVITAVRDVLMPMVAAAATGPRVDHGSR